MKTRKKFLRLKGVIERISIARSTFLEKVKKGLWPPQIHLGPGISVWIDDELSTVMEAYAAGCNQEEIKTLILKLISERKSRASGDSNDEQDS